MELRIIAPRAIDYFDVPLDLNDKIDTLSTSLCVSAAIWTGNQRALAGATRLAGAPQTVL
jgi:hypothetical protein